MENIRTYIIKEMLIDEGKFLDIIKNWWNNLFKPTDKKFDRYNDNFLYAKNNKRDYDDYIKSSYDKNKITISKIVTVEEFNKIINPNNQKPDKDENIGFWEYIDDNFNKDKYEYYSFIYEDKKVKDVIAIIKLNTLSVISEKYYEIDKLQIIQEYKSLFKISSLFNLMINNNKIVNKKQGFIYKKEKNTSFYNTLINKCEFDKVKINSVEVAIKEV